MNHFQTIADCPFLDTQQMIEVDRAMMQDYRIDLIQMMENAGRNLAHLARARFLDGSPNGRKITVLAGTGGNGGGVLAAARHLHNWGAEVQVFTSRPAEAFAGVPGHQLDILHRMMVPAAPGESLSHTVQPGLIIDGLIGYSLKGSPRGSVVEMIGWANDHSAPTLSLDIPSGVDAATGAVPGAAIQAAATLTLALPKVGLREPGAKSLVGELYLADISVPPELYERVIPGQSVGALFAESEILRVW